GGRHKDAGLVRVYRHVSGLGSLLVARRPLQPRVALGIQAALEIREREVQALVVYRFMVQAGSVYTVRAVLPAGYSLEDAVVVDGNGNEPRLRRQERKLSGARREISFELEEGLRAGQELLVTLQCQRELPAGVTGKILAIPQFSGSPASEVRGLLGFAPDPGFRIVGQKLHGLLAIPAAELPRAGLDIEGLVLGYRVEAVNYKGEIRVQRRETRVSVEQTARHRVAERVLSSDVELELDVQGAPIESLDLWLPAGTGEVATVTGLGVMAERERVASEEGRERWRISFDRPWSGSRRLELSFQTKLPPAEGETTQATLPQVTVVDAFRARGTLAVFSEGDAELQVTPRELRPIDVTEIPATGSSQSRPLFAFRWVRPDHGLSVAIVRPAEAPVLSAVAEHLEIETSADRDGQARHVAKFRVNNLNNQFFGLELPEGAILWSVVVDGQGVKPASQGGVHVIPITVAGSKAAGETTDVTATYTMPGDWGSFGSASMSAPNLLFGTSTSDVVPVLATSWRLALPEDVQVLELAGNLNGGRRAPVQPALLTGLQAWKSHALVWIALGIGLPLLLLISRAGGRRALLGGAERVQAGGQVLGRGASQARGAMEGHGLKLLLGCGVLGLGMLALSAMLNVLASREPRAASAVPGQGSSAPQLRPASGGFSYDEPTASGTVPQSVGGTPFSPRDERERKSNRRPTFTPLFQDARREAPSKPQYTMSREDAKRPSAKKGRKARPKTKAGYRSRQKAEEGQRLKDAEKKVIDRVGDKSIIPLNARLVPGDEHGDYDEAVEEAEPEKPLVILEQEVEMSRDMPKGTSLSSLSNKNLEGKDLPASEVTAVDPNAYWHSGAKADAGKLRQVDAGLLFGGVQVTAGSAAVAPTIQSEGWQVGLRSLVLDLGAVGQGHTLSRPGGGARLELSFVREGWLLGMAAFLAFLSFLVGAFLPRLLGLSALSLICGGLVTLTLGAALVTDAAPLLNAAVLGLLGTVPLLLLGALSRTWASAPVARLGAAIRELRVQRAAALAPALLFVGLALFGGTPAHAQGKPEAKTPGRVFVPFDSTDPEAALGTKRPKRVFLPREVYEDLMRRAFPERAKVAKAPPPVPALIQNVDYQGRLTEGGLRIRATIAVEVLATGWVEVPLGLTRTGLEASEIKGGLKKARVRVASAGGYLLMARGPARYRVQLDLVVPQNNGSAAFAAVPTLAARLVARTPIAGKKLHVAGARAQQATEVDGESAVLASLGDARTIVVSLRSPEVLSAGASEASAVTQSVVWVRRGRIHLTSKTKFRIAGAGREGFVFGLPAGLEVTEVHVNALRGWRVKGDKLEVTLLRPASGEAVVTIRAEMPLAAGTKTFTAPQITAQGVSRERGSLGVTADAGIKVRPGRTKRLRQVATSELSGVEPRVKTLGWAFGFSRRPCSLELERVQEAVEIHAETKIRASVRPDRYAIDAEVSYDVRRGRVYEVRLLVPAGFALVSHSGLAVREVDETPGEELGFPKGTVVYAFGLASGLEGTARTQRVRFVRRLNLDEATKIPFPDLRPLGVRRETTRIAISTTAGLQIQPDSQPAGLSLEDVKRLTSGWPRAEANGTYRLGYARSSGREAGLAIAACTVTRPKPYQTGSWVLHALVERDVVRYTLRALYEIERAGVSQFGIELPTELARQVSVNAENKREVRILPSKTEGRSLLIVELQSPREVAYDFALNWEQVLTGTEFKIPTLALRGIDRAVRGFVLIEKAPEVTDLLEEGVRTGVIQPARAADAAALPPQKGAEDFVLVYQVPLKRELPWTLSCALKARKVTLPAPAQVLWSHLESVFTRQGQVRHRIRYRVRNLRLQFLAIELPPEAEVWSVFVADRPRRLHHRNGQTLVPLPKRSAADLSFDVELIYATPPSGELGEGTLESIGPKLVTERVEVQQTYWSVYLPEGFRYSGFKGNLVETSQADAEVERVRNEVSELARLEELARNAVGNKQQVADLNLARQRERVTQQLLVCDVASGIASGKTNDGKSLKSVLGKNKEVFRALGLRIQSRQSKAGQQGPNRGDEQVVVGGNSFTRGQSGWNYNDQVYKGKNQKGVWSNVQDLEAPNASPQQDTQQVAAPYHLQTNQAEQQKQQQKRYVMRVQRGKSLSIRNAEVFQQGLNGEQAMLGNLAYQVVDNSTRERKPGFDRNKERAQRTRSEGLLSIKVKFATPGRAHHFVLDAGETPELSFTSAARDTGAFALRVGQGISLILLLVALFRLGLHL
ncbi:MAG: hypothetical protein JKY65_28645, partial [Planctomycetes bacterium]|nr:hypothetical protein [Planctomycetota bacterium]